MTESAMVSVPAPTIQYVGWRAGKGRAASQNRSKKALTKRGLGTRSRTKVATIVRKIDGFLSAMRLQILGCLHENPRLLRREIQNERR